MVHIDGRYQRYRVGLQHVAHQSNQHPNSDVAHNRQYCREPVHILAADNRLDIQVRQNHDQPHYQSEIEHIQNVLDLDRTQLLQQNLE